MPVHPTPTGTGGGSGPVPAAGGFNPFSPRKKQNNAAANHNNNKQQAFEEEEMLRGLSDAHRDLVKNFVGKLKVAGSRPGGGDIKLELWCLPVEVRSAVEAFDFDATGQVIIILTCLLETFASLGMGGEVGDGAGGRGETGQSHPPGCVMAGGGWGWFGDGGGLGMRRKGKVGDEGCDLHVSSRPSLPRPLLTRLSIPAYLSPRPTPSRLPFPCRDRCHPPTYRRLPRCCTPCATTPR